jgi:pyruvate,orthophosphate dikinase
VGRIEIVSEEALPGGADAVLGRGLGASPGAASGRVAIDVDDAVRRSAAGERIVLVRSDASPEDAPAVRAAVAVATASGGLTSHAAVMSRALGRPCAVSVSNLRVRPTEVIVEGRGGSQRLVPGEVVTVDGTRGILVRGAAPTRWVADDEAPRTMAGWAREASDLVVLVDDEGGDPATTARHLEADGVWRGSAAIDATGAVRDDWSGATRWSGPGSRWPNGRVIVVSAGLVAAARVLGASVDPWARG